MVLTGSDSGTARLWQTKTGQPVGEPMRHQGVVATVAFSPNGKAVLTGSDDGTVRVWQVVKETLYSESINALQSEPINLLETWQKKLSIQINEAGKVVLLYQKPE